MKKLSAVLLSQYPCMAFCVISTASVSSHHLRGTGWSFTSEISSSNYLESKCWSHMLMNTRLGSLYKTSINHVEFLLFWNVSYDWMWSTRSFLPFLRCFCSANSNRLQKPSCQQRKRQYVGLTRLWIIYTQLSFLEQILSSMEKRWMDFPHSTLLWTWRDTNIQFSTVALKAGLVQRSFWEINSQCVSSRGENK